MYMRSDGSLIGQVVDVNRDMRLILAIKDQVKMTALLVDNDFNLLKVGQTRGRV